MADEPTQMMTTGNSLRDRRAALRARNGRYPADLVDSVLDSAIAAVDLAQRRINHLETLGANADKRTRELMAAVAEAQGGLSDKQVQMERAERRAEAQQEADQIAEDARAYAQTIVGDARTIADQITREAKAQATASSLPERPGETGDPLADAEAELAWFQQLDQITADGRARINTTIDALQARVDDLKAKAAQLTTAKPALSAVGGDR